MTVFATWLCRDDCILQQRRRNSYANWPTRRQDLNNVHSWSCESYIVQLVPKFARVAALLKKQMNYKNPTRFGLRDAEQQTLNDLNEKFGNLSILASPRAIGQLINESNIWDKRVGNFRKKKKDRREIHSVGYWSRTWNADEKNYNTTQRECLTVIWGVSLLQLHVEVLSEQTIKH